MATKKNSRVCGGNAGQRRLLRRDCVRRGIEVPYWCEPHPPVVKKRPALASVSEPLDDADPAALPFVDEDEDDETHPRFDEGLRRGPYPEFPKHAPAHCGCSGSHAAADANERHDFERRQAEMNAELDDERVPWWRRLLFGKTN